MRDGADADAMKSGAKNLAAKLLPVAVVLPLGGCPTNQIFVHDVRIENPQLSVRDYTDVTVEATAWRPGATLTYEARATRGRVVQANIYSKTFRYYAPYTSRFPDANGTPTTGDTLTVRISDGLTSIDTTKAITLTGNTVVFKGESQNCSNESSSDCNGPLYAGTVDDSGMSVRDIRELRDAQKRHLWGTQPTVSPDGRKLAWVLWPGTDSSGLPHPVNGTAILTLDAGGIVSQITGGGPEQGFNVDPSWSPFGNEMVFASDRGGGGYDIYSVSTEQQNLPVRRLTANPADERYPAWNPNPSLRNILAVSVHANSLKDLGRQDNSAAWNIMLLDTRTSGYTRQITALSQTGPNGPDFALEPRWRLDGQWLAFTQRGPIGNTTSNAARYQRIMVQDSNTSMGSAVPLNPNEQGGVQVGESNAAWSPNGNEIAYLRVTLDGNGNPLSSQLYKGTPNLSKPGQSTPGGSIGPQQWQMGHSIPSLHILSTTARPVGGWSMDWR